MVSYGSKELDYKFLWKILKEVVYVRQGFYYSTSI